MPRPRPRPRGREDILADYSGQFLLYLLLGELDERDASCRWVGCGQFRGCARMGLDQTQVVAEVRVSQRR